MREVPHNSDLYSAAAQSYDSVIEPFAGRMRRGGLRMLSPPAGASVLDIGCGTGSQLALYSEAGCRVYGLDSSAAMLAVARAKLGEAAGLYLGNGAGMPFSSGLFDFVTTTLVLHETAPHNRAAIVGEAGRVAKPGGRLLVTDYHVGPVRRVTGHLFQLAARLVEASVGGEHYCNYRDFVAAGGLRPLFAEAGLVVEKERRVFGEAFAIYRLRRQ